MWYDTAIATFLKSRAINWHQETQAFLCLTHKRFASSERVVTSSNTQHVGVVLTTQFIKRFCFHRSDSQTIRSCTSKQQIIFNNLTISGQRNSTKVTSVESQALKLILIWIKPSSRKNIPRFVGQMVWHWICHFGKHNLKTTWPRASRCYGPCQGKLSNPGFCSWYCKGTLHHCLAQPKQHLKFWKWSFCKQKSNNDAAAEIYRCFPIELQHVECNVSEIEMWPANDLHCLCTTACNVLGVKVSNSNMTLHARFHLLKFLKKQWTEPKQYHHTPPEKTLKKKHLLLWTLLC